MTNCFTSQCITIISFVSPQVRTVFGLSSLNNVGQQIIWVVLRIEPSLYS
jgi:hypothetical protein